MHTDPRTLTKSEIRDWILKLTQRYREKEGIEFSLDVIRDTANELLLKRITQDIRGSLEGLSTQSVIEISSEIGTMIKEQADGPMFQPSVIVKEEPKPKTTKKNTRRNTKKKTKKNTMHH